MIVEVVAVGTELLLGQIVNGNGAWIGSALAESGLDLVVIVDSRVSREGRGTYSGRCRHLQRRTTWVGDLFDAYPPAQPVGTSADKKVHSGIFQKNGTCRMAQPLKVHG